LTSIVHTACILTTMIESIGNSDYFDSAPICVSRATLSGLTLAMIATLPSRRTTQLIPLVSNTIVESLVYNVERKHATDLHIMLNLHHFDMDLFYN